MNKLPALGAVLLLALAVSIGAPAAWAATDVTGDWTAQMQGPNGDMTLTFHFKMDGDKLTGTVDTPMGGDPVPMQNIKLDGDKIYWETSFNGATITHDGTVHGDEMKITFKPTDGSFPETSITLKRTPAKP
jgi:hypothetical protein